MLHTHAFARSTHTQRNTARCSQLTPGATQHAALPQSCPRADRQAPRADVAHACFCSLNSHPAQHCTLLCHSPGPGQTNKRPGHVFWAMPLSLSCKCCSSPVRTCISCVHCASVCKVVLYLAPTQHACLPSHGMIIHIKKG